MKGITEFINESIKAKMLSSKSDFTKGEQKFINSILGTKWYMVTYEDEDYDKVDALIKGMKPTDKFSDDMVYTAYIDDKKGIKVIHMADDTDYQAEAFIIDKDTKDKY